MRLYGARLTHAHCTCRYCGKPTRIKKQLRHAARQQARTEINDQTKPVGKVTEDMLPDNYDLTTWSDLAATDKKIWREPRAQRLLEEVCTPQMSKRYT